MKNLVLIILLINTALTINAQEYQLNRASSKMEWKGYGEIGGFTQQGRISPKNGFVKMWENQLVDGQIIVDMNTIHSEDKQLTKHLKNKDFFLL